MNTIEALEDMQKQILNPSKVHKIGSIATEMIRSHIYQGKFTPLSPLTKSVRGSSAKPLMDTGLLLNSFHYRVEMKDSGNAKVIVGTNHVAAKILNDGGVIKPKRAKYLTIPASQFTRTFERRYGSSPRSVIEGLKNDGWIVFRPIDARTKRARNIILAQKKVFKRNDNRSEAIRLYVLKKSVVIPARNFNTLSSSEIATLTQELV